MTARFGPFGGALPEGRLYRTRRASVAWIFTAAACFGLAMDAWFLLSALARGRSIADVFVGFLGFQSLIFAGWLWGLRPQRAFVGDAELAVAGPGVVQRVPWPAIQSIVRVPDATDNRFELKSRLQISYVLDGEARHVVLALVDEAAFLADVGERVPHAHVDLSGAPAPAPVIAKRAAAASAVPTRREPIAPEPPTPSPPAFETLIVVSAPPSVGDRLRGAAIMALRAWLLGNVLALWGGLAYVLAGSPGPSWLELPWSLVEDYVVSADGSTLVALDPTNRLQLYDARGRFERSAAVPGRRRVRGLAASRDGRLFVVTGQKGSNVVQVDVLDRELRTLQTVSFDAPRALALDVRGDVVQLRERVEAPSRLVENGEAFHPRPHAYESSKRRFAGPGDLVLRRSASGIEARGPGGRAILRPSWWLVPFSLPLPGLLSIVGAFAHLVLRRRTLGADATPGERWAEHQRRLAEESASGTWRTFGIGGIALLFVAGALIGLLRHSLGGSAALAWRIALVVAIFVIVTIHLARKNRRSKHQPCLACDGKGWLRLFPDRDPRLLDEWLPGVAHDGVEGTIACPACQAKGRVAAGPVAIPAGMPMPPPEPRYRLLRGALTVLCVAAMGILWLGGGMFLHALFGKPSSDEAMPLMLASLVWAGILVSCLGWVTLRINRIGRPPET